MSQKINLIHGDCLEEMAKIEPKSIDMVICDPPYGITQNDWDKIIPFDKIWVELKRIRKIKTPIFFFNQQPFTTDLINSNRLEYRYSWVWIKSHSTGFLNAYRMPMRISEEIAVFYNKLPYYNPIKKVKPKKNRRKKNHIIIDKNTTYGKYNPNLKKNRIDESFPNNILYFNNDQKVKHPSVKPVKLYEYFIETYSKENDTVLDFCMGSGTGAIACYNLNRNFIGIEKEKKYFDSANERLNKHRDTLIEWVKAIA